jgi:uncharacterized protein YceK
MRMGVALAFAASTALAGCGPILTKYADTNSGLVAADALSVSDDEVKMVGSSADLTVKKEFLGRVARDSVAKCNTFMNRLAVTENTVNTAGDVTATVLSALATILTPVATIHALTGASTIVTGTKSTIDADIYAKATIANFQSALAATYYKSINDYAAVLPKLTASDLVVAAEISKIETIHSTCGLAPAQLTISATLAASNSSSICQFTSGPKKDQTTDLSPIKLPIGTPCSDGAGSSGVIISAGSSGDHTKGAAPGVVP